MEGDELFLQACRTPLPPDDDEISDDEDVEDVESDVEDYLVYDEVSQVCVLCDVVLQSPSFGPLCRYCHSYMYPEYTILQKEFDEIRLKSAQKERYIPYYPNANPSRPIRRPRHRCGKDGTLKNKSVNKADGSASEQVKLPTILCFSDTESEHEDESDSELLGLAQLAIYDKEMIQYNVKSSEEIETSIKDDLVEMMPTEGTC
jgi:hypothetical protein